MRIARVFPTKTSYCPTDKDCYFDVPDMFTPQYDEVHISVVFTWDIPKADRMAEAWASKGKVIKGGPAFNDAGFGEFKAGEYVRHGVTFTSRGCPNHCKFCLVPKREGGLRECAIVAVNIVQDNNFLACSYNHRKKVFKMLRNQRRIEFKGGLEAARVTSNISEDLRGLSIRTLWLACDYPGAIKLLRKAVSILLKAGFTRSHLYCYALIGKDMNEEKARLQEIWDIGCMPFAQLEQPAEGIFLSDKYDVSKKEYSHDWKKLQRTWSRPAATRCEASK